MAAFAVFYRQSFELLLAFYRGNRSLWIRTREHVQEQRYGNGVGGGDLELLVVYDAWTGALGGVHTKIRSSHGVTEIRIHDARALLL